MMKQPVRTNVSDFIKSTMGSQFVIPVYQRNYTWNPDEETARFMNDIEDLLKHKNNAHFLGILIYKEFERSAMVKEFSIVDGQQRLTTSFLFLACLKRIAFENKDKETAGMIEDFYLYNRHAGADARMRLRPTITDDDTYERIIYGSKKDLTRKDKDSNVYRNYEAIYQRIIELNRKYQLIEILDTLGRMDILAFPLSESDDSQQIFESINSTGAPLTSADLIRNYILMNDPSDVQERNYRLYWHPLEEYYPQSRKLEEFFRIYLAAKTYSFLSKRDVYEGFKTFWKSSGASHEERLREINRYARYYYVIYNGTCEEEQVEKVLRDFRRNESRIPAPFLVEMYHLYDDEKIDARTFASQVNLIDSYLTRRALCGMDNGSLSRYFPQLLRSVINQWRKKHRNINEVTRVFLINYNKGKSLAMPTDAQLRTRLREMNAYALPCIRPVLERIEHHGATAEVDTSELNIEHIMPQHPNPWWKKNCGAQDEDEYTFYANLIGNLTLCAQYDNTRMGNQDLRFKQNVLRKTMHIRMNTGLLEMKHWTVEDILDRCDCLSREIIAIYPYQGGNVNTEVERDDDIILLNTPNVNVRAQYVNPQRIEILAGSTMRPYGDKEMKSMRALYRQISEKGILFEDEYGMVRFEKNFRFSDLNTAAQFLLHRGGDNTAAWTRENGEQFLQKKEPAEIPKKPAVLNEKAKVPAQPKNKTEGKAKPVKQKAPVKKTGKGNDSPKTIRPADREKKTSVKPGKSNAEVRTYSAKDKTVTKTAKTEQPSEKKQSFFKSLFKKSA